MAFGGTATMSQTALTEAEYAELIQFLRLGISSGLDFCVF